MLYAFAYVGVGWFFLLGRWLVAWNDALEFSPQLLRIFLMMYGLFWPEIWIYRLTGMGFGLVTWLVDVIVGARDDQFQ